MAQPTFDDEELDPELLGQLGELDPDLLAQLGDPAQVDPTIAAREVSRYAVDPELTPERVGELGELTDIGAMLEGRDVGFLEGVGDRLSQAWLNMTTADPMELADILTNRFPDTIEVRLSPEGVPVARNKHTGHEVAINRPGFSPMDVMQTIGLVGQYTPAGKFAAAPLAAVKQGLTKEATRQARKRATRSAIGRGVAGETATEVGAQAVQEAAGGRFDPGEVAFTALTAPVPEVVLTPMAGLGRKTYDIVTDNVKIPDGVQAAIDYARDKGYKVATSDALAETIKAPRRIFLKAAERIPLVGTSGMRLRQAQERAEALEHMFDYMGLDASTDYGALVLNSFVRKNKSTVAEANRLRTAAFDAMKGTGNVPLKSFRNQISEEIEAAGKLEPDQKKALLNYLTSVSKDFDAIDSFTFRDADIFLNSLYRDPNRQLANAGIKGEMQARLAEALYKDMSRHAKANSSSAFNKYDLARKNWVNQLKKVADEELRNAISTGQIDEGVIDRVLYHGKPKDVESLWQNVDAAGKELIRKRTMADVLNKAGGRLGDLSTVNVDRMIRILDTDPGVQRAMKKFWPEEDQKLIQGMKEYLRLTAKSAKAFEATGMLAGGQAASGGGRMLTGLVSALLPPTQMIVGAARAHESDAVRDLLLKLYNAKGASDKVQSIMAELRPALIALGQQQGEGRDPFAPEIEKTTFEKALEGSGRAGKQLYDAVTGFELPGIDENMQRLREAAGAEEE